MRISALTGSMVSERVVRRLGLDPSVHDAFTPEATAESLRRAASLLCPATPREIVDTVRSAILPLSGAADVTRDTLVTQLDLLIANGDLLELRQAGRAGRLIYLGPPSFVASVPGHYLLLGVRSEGQALTSEELSERIEHEGHLRFVALDPDTGPELLKSAGLQELRIDRWLQHPRASTAADHVGAARRRLDAALEAGAVAGLELVDSSRPVHYYRGRWRPPEKADDGDFLGRRPQAYGAASWCFVRIVNGHPTRLLDLPIESAGAQARDEAWRLQAAIDATRGTPQRYRLRQVPNTSSSILDLFGPVPSWVARHLDLVATPVIKSRSALLSYRLTKAAIPNTTGLLTGMLWMRPVDEED